MALEKGKDPVPLINTTEETSAPSTVAGPGQIAFVMGPTPQQTIGIAETATGRITHKIETSKGQIVSIAASPDGKTLYFAAGGSIWTVAASGGEPRMIRAGDTLVADPSGRFLIVGIFESTRVKLFRVPLDGGTEQEIQVNGPIPIQNANLAPNSLSSDGRLLVSLTPPDSWFNPPGLLDIATGRLTRLSADDVSDYHSFAWLSDGQVVMMHLGLDATLWRFQPETKGR